MTDGKDVGKRKKRTKQTSLTLHPRDLELIAWGAEYIGCMKGEFVRTAVRAYVHHLEVLARGGRAS